MNVLTSCEHCGSQSLKVKLSATLKDRYYELVSHDPRPIPMTWLCCESCELLFRAERLDQDQTNALYRHYRDAAVRNESPDEYFDRITRIAPAESENFTRAAVLKNILDARKFSGAKCHMDIGAGAGVFIDTFRRLNPDWSSYAVEATPSYAETASRRLGIPVHTGFYSSGIFGIQFRLITLLQVLEHIAHQRDILTQIRKDLARAGILFIEVPSAKNVEVLPVAHDMFTIPHVCLFSVKTLSRILEACGYRVLEINEYLSRRSTYQVRAVCEINS